MAILSGYKRFKKYLRTGEGYKLCSEWTKSDSVEMTDGSTLQETMDNITSDVENTQNGITDIHNELMTSLGGMTFGVDAAGRYGYIKAGADTVTPFKNVEAILSDVLFDCINSQKTVWNSKGTDFAVATWNVPNDGLLEIVCKYNYYRVANQTTSNSNRQWHSIWINDKEVLSTSKGDVVLITPLTFNVKKNDKIEFRWYISWTGGDSIYALMVAIMGVLFSET